MVPGEDSWFSLPDINCASILVSITFDQSDGDRGYAGARNGEGFSSSSLALTTLDSFEGRRDNSLFSSPVIWFRRKKRKTFQRRQNIEAETSRQHRRNTERSYLHSYCTGIPLLGTNTTSVNRDRL